MSCLKTEAQMRMTGELASSLYPISCPLAGGFGHLVAWRLAPRASPPAQLLPAPQSASPLAPPAPPLTLPTVLPDHAGHYLAPNWGRSVEQRKTGRLVRWSLRRSGWRRWRRLATLGWFPIGGSRCQNYFPISPSQYQAAIPELRRAGLTDREMLKMMNTQKMWQWEERGRMAWVAGLLMQTKNKTEQIYKKFWARYFLSFPLFCGAYSEAGGKESWLVE